MKHSHFYPVLACLVFLSLGHANASQVLAVATPEWAPDTILVGDTFIVEIHMYNDYGELGGVSFPWVMYSPDQSITHITHTVVDTTVDTGHVYSAQTSDWPPQYYNDSSILMYNGYDALWPLVFLWAGWSWDGTLPDTINFSGLSMAGWPPDSDTTLYMGFALQIDEPGTFCIDSIKHPNGTYDWLFDDPNVTFNGPYCWTIWDTAYVPNNPPVLDSIGDKEVDEGVELTFDVTATDPDGTIPSLSTSALPEGANFTDNHNGSGSFSWTPTYEQAGDHPVTFYASDGEDADSAQITITVKDVNRAPVLDQIADGTQFVNEGDSLILDVSASDPDGTTPTLIAEDLVDNATFTDNGDGTGVFKFHPDTNQAGDYNIRFIATDGELADSEMVAITVTEAGENPCLAVDPNPLQFFVNACDTALMADTLYLYITNCGGGTLEWTINDPVWFEFDKMSGAGDDSVAVNVKPGILEQLADSLLPYYGDTVYAEVTSTVEAVDALNSPITMVYEIVFYCDPGDAVLASDPTSFEFTLDPGDSLVAESLYVYEESGRSLGFWISGGLSDWLEIDTAVASPLITPGTIFFDIKTSALMPGTYSDTIFINSYNVANSPLGIPIILTVEGAEPDYVVETAPTSFNWTLAQGDIAYDSLHVFETYDRLVDFIFSNDSAWLEINSTGIPPYSTPMTLQITVTTASLAPGSYTDTIVIESDADSALFPTVIVPVALTVEEPVIWAQVDSSTGTTPDTVEFTVDAADLEAGSYEDMFYIINTTETDKDPMDYDPDLVLSDTIFNFTAIEGFPGLEGMSLEITSSDPQCEATFAIYHSSEVDPDTIPEDRLYRLHFFLVVWEEGATIDSVWVSTVPGVPGSDVIVPIYFRNFEALSAINLPLTWNSDAIYLNEVTFDGTRVDYVDSKPVAIDNPSRRVQIGVIPTFTDNIDPGRGMLAKLHFTIAEGAASGVVIIDTAAILPDGGLVFIDEALEIIYPTYITGAVVIDTSAGFVCGRVVDTAGNEIEGATVDLWDDFPAGYLILSETTDINGQFACHTSGVSPFDAYAYKEGYYPGLEKDIQFGEIGIEIVLTPISPIPQTNEWVDFYCDDNYYFGVPLPVGSVVDAYDPDGVHCGTFYVTEAGRYGFMPVYRDDIYTIEDDGAEPGDTIIFFINGYPADAVGDRVWTQNGDNFEVCLDVFTVEDRMTVLNEGWNLISWNVDTPSDDIEQVLSSISDNIEVVLGFEQGGFSYDPDLPEFSTLWKTDHFHGYWIKMNGVDTLAVTGVPIAATTPIKLESGWNLVSYLPDTADTTPHALNSVHDNLIVALGFDTVAQTYDPLLPDYSTLPFMRPGFGYWLKVFTGDMLVYPGIGPEVVFRQTLARADKAAVNNRVNVSRLWMNIYAYELTLDGDLIPTGTEVVAIAPNGRVVGAGTVGEDGKFGFVPIYGDDPTTIEKDGLVPGEEFILVIDGIETAESFVWSEPGDRVEIGSLTARTGGELLPDDFRLIQNFPNPFNPTTTISFSVPTAMHTTLEVYNILGKKVITLFDDIATAGTNIVVWDGVDENGGPVASGIYLYRMRAGDFQKTNKMVLMK